MSQDSPVFAKAYDLLRWPLPAAAKFPKQQRFVLTRPIEDAAFGCQRALLAAGREPHRGLPEADLQLAALRTYLRRACELRFMSINQFRLAGRRLAGPAQGKSGHSTRTVPESFLRKALG